MLIGCSIQRSISYTKRYMRLFQTLELLDIEDSTTKRTMKIKDRRLSSSLLPQFKVESNNYESYKFYLFFSDKIYKRED